MTSLGPYLVFPGVCREAMEFYRKSLNGEITVMETFAESHLDVPEEYEDRIFNSELKVGSVVLRASDDLPSHPVTVGSNISLFAVFPDRQAEVEALEALSEGGKVLFPIRDNFGMATDKYGVQWMFVHKSE